MGRTILAVSSLSLLFAAVPLRAQLFQGKPDIVVCSVAQSSINDAWQDLVFYISGTQKGGFTLYKSLTSNPVLVRIDESGRVSAPNLADCDGKNVSELLNNGRAAYFSKHKKAQ